MHIQLPQTDLPEFRLGNLIHARRSLQNPTREYQDLNTEIEVTTTTIKNSKYLYHGERNTNYNLPSKILSGRYISSQSRETLVQGATQYVCQVRNPEAVLKRALNCRETGVRVQKWIRQKAKLHQKVYMIVGLCTLRNPRLVEKTTYRRLLKAVMVDPCTILCNLVGVQILPEYSIKITVSINSKEEKVSINIFEAVGECVWAVQYQRVEFTCGTPSDESRLTNTHWVVVAVGFTKQRGWAPSPGDCRLECPFGNMEKAGLVGYDLDFLPYTASHVVCNLRAIRVGCSLQFSQLRLNWHW
ncbi:hypothetical protein L211DRAFT_832375 [Terfezia boudieri ATCC MYA-4762]|uniref:Uncharacterized protein n=1 Tax=Terfezia boudieri ATCC MYA-4762 TaxID=1051890 RepID=A0A3N4M7I6_9PEZI|nr:hypothetical protein L211DRAFT_832375 [Terfezia boudieri ATCC MYA-4762]